MIVLNLFRRIVERRGAREVQAKSRRLARIYLAFGICAVPALRADVTIRYTLEIHPSPALPAAVQSALKALAAKRGPISLRIKGQKGYLVDGREATIFDYEKKQLIYITPACQTYDFDRMPEFFPNNEPQLSKPVQLATASVTGRTRMIQGVEAEERALSASILPPPKLQNGQVIRLVSRIWIPSHPESSRLPAVHELAGLQWGGRQSLPSPGPPVLEFVRTLLDMAKRPDVAKMPAGAELRLRAMVAVTNMFAAPQRDALFTLRVETEVYFPFALAGQEGVEGKEQNQPGPATATPTLRITRVVTELSDAPVDAAVFDLPKDYHVRSSADYGCVFARP